MRKFNVTVNGKTYSVEVEEADGSESVATRETAPAPAAHKAAEQAATVPTGGTAVTAPMPGLVLKLCVPDGAKVNKGDKIVVLEAMKMENDIAANASGTIHFAVKQGDNVETAAKLAVIS